MNEEIKEAVKAFYENSHLEKVKEKFEETANQQELKGIEKYGQLLDPLDNYDWLKMAAEEQVDGFKYLVAEMEKRKFIVNKLRNLIDHKSEWGSYEEIMHWLDELGGKES